MPEGKRIYSHKLKAKDQFKFTSAESGPHLICLFTTSAGWFSSTKTVRILGHLRLLVRLFV